MSETIAKEGLPLVVQLGFAGSRFIFDPQKHPQMDGAAFEQAVQDKLAERLRQLPTELGLGQQHFLCGLSQLAIGADTMFTCICRDLGWLQRFFLPQHVDDFLQAAGADGKTDFTEAQQEEARKLFASWHAIETRVVATSPDRNSRFHEVNLELVRVSDVIVCLIGTSGRARGGTHELIEDASHRERPLLEIQVTVDGNNRPEFSEVWHHREKFKLPRLPEDLAGLQTTLTGIPLLAAYGDELQKFASEESRLRQASFKHAAQLIIFTHLVATVCAVCALKMHGMPWEQWLPWVLGGELGLLLLGFSIHHKLHGSQAVRVWALARLVAEIARSVRALHFLPSYLAYFFHLPLPDTLLPLLRTLNILHLKDAPLLQKTSWTDVRDHYVQTRLVQERLNDLEEGQLPYYEGKLKSARAWLGFARYGFLAGSGLAIVATFAKLCVVGLHVDKGHLESTLGILAVVLPLLAVAALSLAASFDLEARVHTYDEMSKFLNERKKLLENVPSERAFEKLALETEARLLGETAHWYSRRVFTGVA